MPKPARPRCHPAHSPPPPTCLCNRFIKSIASSHGARRHASQIPHPAGLIGAGRSQRRGRGARLDVRLRVWGNGMKHAWLGLAAGLAAGSFWGAAGATAAPLPESAALDCAKPTRRVDRAICRNPALVAVDRDLAALAAELAQRLENPPLLQAAQQDWTQRRNRMCAPGYAPECLTIAYAEREAWLRARLAAMPQAVALPLAAPSTAAPPVAAIPLAPPPLAAPSAATTSPAAPTSARPTFARPVPAAPQPPNAMPGTAAPPAPPAALARPPAPQPSPPGQSLATQLAIAPCAMVNSNAVRGAGWAAGQAPFGMPLQQWTQQDFSALSTRIQECQAENGESLRNVQMLQAFLGSFRNSAPVGPVSPRRRIAHATPWRQATQHARCCRTHRPGLCGPSPAQRRRLHLPVAAGGCGAGQ
jgi:uncharacterized protein